ncbi:hypothetical protein DICPUDRAFT_58194 [Dictyostelium purpureum]|uniref:phosphatidylinositol 3-kinase n=1 Tax=Dictyostelium purpureum TaxID=5786 RepID=F0ZZM8_DICPU|nr:uncharacterized protein DICPUDRAFT_58194 [Dictyostelium purpureum]EGC30605.1 hypothetical protein DICPUDRAFT_58194 [Dictyostelium purpureum]|eukprot:XP_003292869.1 hypothetical protein DICPUDRAFT_58194 [Dictyostelium purpureum]
MNTVTERNNNELNSNTSNDNNVNKISNSNNNNNNNNQDSLSQIDQHQQDKFKLKQQKLKERENYLEDILGKQISDFEEEMAEQIKKINSDPQNHHDDAHHNPVQEEHDRIEHEINEIKGVYNKRNMEFHKDLRFEGQTRMREGSILNLEKQGLVKVISQRFQTPDTASYTRPAISNSSIKDKILNMKKEQERKKLEMETQQREKVIILSEDSSSLQVYHPSVLIDRMNSKPGDKLETDNNNLATTSTDNSASANNGNNITSVKPNTAAAPILVNSPIKLSPSALSTPSTLSSMPLSPIVANNPTKNNNNSGSPSNNPYITTNTISKDNKDKIKKDSKEKNKEKEKIKSKEKEKEKEKKQQVKNAPPNELIRKRRGRTLITPSVDAKKNLQIYFTIPEKPIQKVIPTKPILKPFTSTSQQFLKDLVKESTDIKETTSKVEGSSLSLSFESEGSSLAINNNAEASLLNVTSLRVRALKTPFNILFILPNQSRKTLLVKGTDTIEVLKERLASEYLESFPKSNRYGSDSYLLLDFNNTPLEKTLSLNKCEYILEKRSKGLLPKLKMIEKSDILEADSREELSPQEYDIIRKIIPNTSNLKGDEVDYFRRVTSRQRYEALPHIKGSIQSTLLPRLSILPIPIVANKILISVFLPITQVTKTLDLEPNETADAFTNRIFVKNYSKHLPNVNASDFILKVVGSSEYIHGPYDIRTFECIRNHIIQSTKPQLTLIQRPKSELDPPPFKPRFDFPPELSIDCEVSDYRTDIWDQLTHFSIRDIKRPFCVKVLGSSKIPMNCVKDEDTSIIVSISLYHGIDNFSKVFTRPLNPSTPSLSSDSLALDWNELLVFNNIEYSNLPIDARLSISIYSTNDSVDEQDIRNHDQSTKKLTPIGWANLMISDFRHQLRQGLVQLSLWPNEFSNPLGTCSNNPNPNSVNLILEFEEFDLPVIFPRNKKIPNVEPPTINSNDMRDFFESITNLDPLSDLKPDKYSQLWALRHYAMLFPSVLPRLMLSVPWMQAVAVDEAYNLLERWPRLKPYEALELLDAKHANRKVRDFAVSCLEELSEDELLDILLQLVQVLKYEPFHDTKLSRFLLRKAILHRSIGHSFFWYLKSDLHVLNLSERFGILLESYLYACGAHRVELLKQLDVINNLTDVAKKIKPLKDQDRKDFMLKELESIDWPKRFHLTLNPRLESNGLIINKSKYMDSKKLPLRLSFTNTDMNADPIEVIFKAGDDLRQDMLTLQMIRLMDKLWQKEGLDLKLSPYGCISTGDMIGMIEVVLNAETTAKIQKSAGGATAAFKLDPLANWLLQHNKTEIEYQRAVDTFILSCAGYCVATYVLGIGDRHNDNLMCTKLGRLFHIDFGHFLGNYKKKFGFKRECAPFVFTPDFCYVMGGKESPKFAQFVNYCCTAYNILRKNAKLFMNLFAMMVSTGIPELQSMEDLNYLKESFSLELSDDKARDKFINLIHESLSTKRTQLNNAIHIAFHP